MSIKLKVQDIPDEDIGRELYELVNKISASKSKIKHVYKE